MISQEAAEARHKDLQVYRLRHTRKDSPLHTMSDLFDHLLITSNPLISSLRQEDDASSWPVGTDCFCQRCGRCWRPQRPPSRVAAAAVTKASAATAAAAVTSGSSEREMMN